MQKSPPFPPLIHTSTHLTIRFNWPMLHSVGRIFLLAKSNSHTRKVPSPAVTNILSLLLAHFTVKVVPAD